MELGVVLPKVYAISRNAKPGLVQTTIAALTITPISCVIISDMKDFPMAQEFGALIIRTMNDMNSLAFALESYKETQMPSLVIMERNGIAAVYEDGRVEDLLWQAAGLTPN